MMRPSCLNIGMNYFPIHIRCRLEDQERQYEILKDFDGRTVLESIEVPTLVGYGAEDLLAIPTESKFLADNIKNAQLHEFACGHDIPHEMPEELARVLIEFFSEE